MYKKNMIISVLFLIFFNAGGRADTWNDVRNGIKAYKNSNSDQSLEHFKSALEKKPDDPLLYFNLGDAYYQKGNFQEAEKFFKRSSTANDQILQQSSWYNLGNTYVNLQQLDKALESYKKAIDLNPDDLDAKYNYEFIRKNMQQNQQQNQQQNKNQEQQQNQDQDNQNGQQKNEEQQKQDEQKFEQQEQKKQDSQEDDQIDKNTAEQILEALRQKEKENQKKARMYQGKPIKVEKDW